MIRIIVFLFLTLNLIGESYAQSRSGDSHIYPSPVVSIEVSHSRLAMEEVYFPSFGDECTLEIVTIGVEGVWGRISGMNGFGDLEKAQRIEFSASDSYQVVAALMFFERPSVVGNGSLNVKVYEEDPDMGGPGLLKGFSNGIKVSEIVVPDSVARATVLNFEGGVEVNLDKSRFYLSCDFASLYSSRDTVGR